jgi:hypothetical protein
LTVRLRISFHEREGSSVGLSGVPAFDAISTSRVPRETLGYTFHGA